MCDQPATRLPQHMKQQQLGIDTFAKARAGGIQDMAHIRWHVGSLQEDGNAVVVDAGKRARYTHKNRRLLVRAM